MKKLGFTLIEVMVVVSIFGLLSSMTLTSLKVVKQKAVNAKFVSELRSLQKAAIFYQSNHGDVAIACPFIGQCGQGPTGPFTYDFDTVFAPLVSGKYISKIPKYPDPNNFSGPWVSMEYFPNQAPSLGRYYCRAVTSYQTTPPPAVLYILSPLVLDLPKGMTTCFNSPNNCTYRDHVDLPFTMYEYCLEFDYGYK